MEEVVHARMRALFLYVNKIWNLYLFFLLREYATWFFKNFNKTWSNLNKLFNSFLCEIRAWLVTCASFPFVYGG